MGAHLDRNSHFAFNRTSPDRKLIFDSTRPRPVIFEDEKPQEAWSIDQDKLGES